MDDTFRDLYYGRINPFGMKIARDEEIDGLIKRSQKLEHEIFGILDEAGKKKFTEFLNVDGDLGDSQQFQAFCRGFRVGTRLMIETFVDNPEKQADACLNGIGGAIDKK